MRTMFRFFVMPLAVVLALSLPFGIKAYGQESSFPYSYNWTGAAALSSSGGGDGNYRTSSSGSAPDWGIVSFGGVGDSPSAAIAGFSALNKESNLDLLLNTSSKTFDGSETYQFMVAVSVVPDANVGTIRVQENSSGSFVDVPGSLTDLHNLSTVPSPYFVLLPTSVGDKTSVTLRIVIKSLSNGVSTPQVFVDDNSISGGALPIQLASSAAYLIRDNDVELAWRTLSETNNYGFEIYRKRGEAGNWTKIGFVEGHGTTLTPQAYSYSDLGVSFGKYYYRIKQVDLNGQSTEYPAMEVTVGTGPEKFALAQNYPNPFNPSTLIDFVVPQSGFASMKVYNLLGQEVATLFEGNADGDRVYTVRFNASNVPSGLYFYTLKSVGKSETKRMLLMK